MKINAVKKITNYPFINLYSAGYTDRLGQEKSWVFASRSQDENPQAEDKRRPDAVVVVPYHIDRRKLVLIREFRVALGKRVYGFPAGLVDPGESRAEAAERELFEETGLKVSQVIRKSPAVFSSSGLTDESVSLVFVECQGRPSSRGNEASEEIETLFFSRRQAAALLERTDVCVDVKTWIVLDGFAGPGFPGRQAGPDGAAVTDRDPGGV